MSAILNSGHLGIHPSCTKTSLIPSHWTWWWQPSLTSAKIGFSHCHIAFKHLVIFTHTSLPKHSGTNLTLTQPHSFRLKLNDGGSSWWWQPSWIGPSWIQTLGICGIQTPCFLLSGFTQKHSPSTLTLTQTNSIWFKLIHSHLTWWWWPSWILPIFNSANLDSASGILDSDTLFSSLRFTQKHSPSTLTLTQTNSIWLKLIHSHSTWWWQPSWILPFWIWPSWNQPS